MALSPLLENYQSDIQEFVQENGKRILVQSTEMGDFAETIDIVEKINRVFPNTADLALGIHPTIFEEAVQRSSLTGLDIFKYSKKQLSFFEDSLEKNIEEVKAIGETGLDYFNMNTYGQFSNQQKEDLTEVQKLSFRLHCKLAKKYSLPLSIHSRDISGSNKCTKDVLEILAQEGKGILTGCFHSYTGEIDMVEEILNMGFYIGFNAIITYPAGENVREILKVTPVERILFETDGPFLPTQSLRKNKKDLKRYGRPVLIKEIIQHAAKVKNISAKSLEEITDSNYTTLFGS
ncbi:MAG: TatD family hydrolase [Candidatus Dojkabacteria bacterium]|jgi:TatD family hydrolase|nr:TatD family hydrolase [Candidatus Dojkabacteria bacterium]